MPTVTTLGPGQSVGSITMNGSWSGARACGACVCLGWSFEARFVYNIGAGEQQVIVGTFCATSGNFSSGLGVPVDTTIYYRARGRSLEADCCTPEGFVEGGDTNFRTFAGGISWGTPTAGTPTQTSCPLSITYNPNTVESSGEVNIEYRVQGSGTWLVGPTIATSQQGDFSRLVSGALTGLNPSTSYEFRFRSVRNTSNDTIGHSGVGTFSTSPGDPVIQYG